VDLAELLADALDEGADVGAVAVGSIAESWVDQDEPSERGKVRMEEALDAAIRSLTFALPELLALPEAKLARRIARRYVAGMREQLKEKAAS
jgi:hypothetical protein